MLAQNAQKKGGVYKIENQKAEMKMCGKYKYKIAMIQEIRGFWPVSKSKKIDINSKAIAMQL